MLLTKIPPEIVFEIVKYTSTIKDIFNCLSLSKEFYELTEYDIFWKYLLKFYLLNGIKNCKDWLNDLILSKDLLQQFLDINSIESKNTNKKKKFNLNQLNQFKLLSVTINCKLLQNFSDFYKLNIIQLNSINRNFKEENDNIDSNQNLLFSKKFKHLLQQCIKSKWSILFNNISPFINVNFLQLFLKIFFLNNNSTICLEQYLQSFNTDNKEYEIQRNNLKYILQLFNQIKENIYLKNLFFSNLTISLNSFHEICKNKLHKESEEFSNFCLQRLDFDNLYKNYDYSEVSKIINYLMEDYNNNNDEAFCNRLNYILNFFFTKNCDKQRLMNYLNDFILNKLDKLLINKEDKSKEISNLFNSLQFIKYELTLDIYFFTLQYNFNNFLYLTKLNIISKKSLLEIFHYNLIKNGFNFLINETVATIDRKYIIVDSYNNIIETSLQYTNYSVIIKIIKECCNLQQIDYNKLDAFKYNYYSDYCITKQLIYYFTDNILYEKYLLEQIKLETIKEILTIKNISHIHLFELAYGFRSTVFYKKEEKYIFEDYTLLSLKYLISNVKVFNTEFTLQEYVNEMLKREDELVLNNLIISKREEIVNGNRRRIDVVNSDLFIYFIYKNIKNVTEELENKKDSG
ncbi:hypothetical protein ABK040_014859 [Willaertia magna]